MYNIPHITFTGEGLMLPDLWKTFVTRNHIGVMTTFRRNKSIQMSIVTCGPYANGIAFTTTIKSAKVINLERDSHCSLLISEPNWTGYLVIEGYALISSSTNTRGNELQQSFRDLYRASGGGEHPNWKEFDEAMKSDGRVIITVIPEHTYGFQMHTDNS